MGRIAEAIKKARQEREEQFRLGLADREVKPVEKTCSAVARQVQPAAAAKDRVAAAVLDRMASAAGGRGVQGMAAVRGLVSGISSKADSAPLGPMPTWDVHPTVVCVHERSSSVAEQYRAVRTWLLRRNTAGEHLSLAVTSSIPREGKSVTAANLAVCMAEVRHKSILAVDCDLRQSSLSRLFKVSNVPGLAEVLAGKATLAEAIAPTPLGNLFILPSGCCQGINPTELLNSPMATRAFDEIRERYHYVLVDTPPVQKLSDVGVIGALCTGILMVVRMHMTPSNLVRQSLHWLQSNNLNVIGCVAASCSLRDARHMYRDAYEEEK
jgi:capsular exopolysaccharide synthesis family protein